MTTDSNMKKSKIEIHKIIQTREVCSKIRNNAKESQDLVQMESEICKI